MKISVNVPVCMYCHLCLAVLQGVGRCIANLTAFNPRGNKFIGKGVKQFGDLCRTWALSGIIQKMICLQGMRFPFNLDLTSVKACTQSGALNIR